jgi:peptidoglycan/xylan/chitin deacetylase (PgdA/CDA1 family)
VASELIPPFLSTLVGLLIIVVLALFLANVYRRRRKLPALGPTPRLVLGALIPIVLLAAISTVWQRERAAQRLRYFEHSQLATESNLLSSEFIVVDSLTGTVPISVPSTSTIHLQDRRSQVIDLEAQHYLASTVIGVQPGQTLRYSLKVASPLDSPGTYQVRLVWYDKALSVLSWSDSPPFQSAPTRASGADENYWSGAFRTAVYEVPAGGRYVRLEVRNTGSTVAMVSGLKLSPLGAYVEAHPNGARGSVAFSFDWETAMGGPIHSQGMTEHDPDSAAKHGLMMRQGADWLKELFDTYKVKGTFYATGYNLLDGNTGGRTFSGDPTYKWASPKNRWSSDYWLTHKWFSDDPHGTVQSAPEWYFGDQTRALLRAGHEIAPHTFGHLYVRGAKPGELATDLDEWLGTSQAVGVPRPSTFAFPWRSSNSLTPDFYDVLYSRGIRAVTRLYEPDLRDLYTVSAVPTYTQMLVMPDFRLEAPTSNVVEEAAGEIIGVEEGMQVLDEVISRRGTTSFWTHPEQLADSPDFEQVKRNWRGVVSDAAARRDKGLLWIGTVGEIIAYQRDVMSVTTSLEPLFLGPGSWALEVHNNSGHDIKGLTLTLPAEGAIIDSGSVAIATARREGDKVMLSPAGQPAFPARQLVFGSLPLGTTRLTVRWADGQEPPP